MEGTERRRRLLVVTAWAMLASLAFLGAAWFVAGVFGWHYCTDFSRSSDGNYYMRCYDPPPSVVGAVALAVVGSAALALAIRRARLRRHS